MNDVLCITEGYAQNVFAARQRLESQPLRQAWEWARLERSNAKCGLLVHLDEQSALPFGLKELIGDAIPPGEQSLLLRERNKAD